MYAAAKYYFRMCLFFVLLAMPYVYFVRGFTLSFLPGFLFSLSVMVHSFFDGPFASIFVGIFALIILFRRTLILPMVYVVIGTILFSPAFVMIKTTIPTVVPFWADPVLAQVDLWLLGRHAYELTQFAEGLLDPEKIVRFYMQLWGLFAMLFPILVVLGDMNPMRQRLFLTLYVGTWIVLGCVLATLFSSAGPIYFENVTGEDLVSGLFQALDTRGLSDTPISQTQAGLWHLYERDGGQQLHGAGISAFPSLHVAMAAIWCVYLMVRSWLLGIVGLAYMVLVLFLSVYTGWHYFVDGLASICLVVMLYAAFRRYFRDKLGVSQRNMPSEIDQTLA